MSQFKVGWIYFSLILSVVLSGCGLQDNIVFRNIRFSPPQDNVVTAMTFNIRTDTMLDGLNSWATRKQRVIDMIAGNAPDVIGLQEARARQVQDIQIALPQYRVYSVGRKDGMRKGESCAILFRIDRFVLNERGTFWYSDSPSEPGSKDWGNLTPRICSWINLIDKNSRKGFYVYNTHLDNFSQYSREKSVRLLAKRVDQRKAQEPFIVMGDFNMELDNPAMRYLQKVGCKTPYPKMVDAWQSLNPGRHASGTRRRRLSDASSGPRVDHIPISENSKALRVWSDRRKVTGKYPSDHFPVIAKIFLGKTNVNN